jgi:hypothetical protein
MIYHQCITGKRRVANQGLILLTADWEEQRTLSGKPDHFQSPHCHTPGEYHEDHEDV